MPEAIAVELAPHDPSWAENAEREATRLAEAVGDVLVTVHHIGSTSIAGIRAKPILDLLPVAADLKALDRARPDIERLGYAWWGEYGLPGRRYCTREDAETGRRLVQLHCYERGSSEIRRHLAFRDYLRARAELAAAYEAEKMRCRALNPDNSHTYNDCKNAWIRRIEAEALRLGYGDSDGLQVNRIGADQAGETCRGN